jgi:hypothetical protein
MPERFVFLDFDGVLNGEDFFAPRAPGSSGELWTADDLDPSRIALLGELVRRSGARVVISSSWRHHHTLEELVAILAGHGFEGEVVGATPRMSYQPRGHEIRTWLVAHGHETAPYVVLDDEDPLGDAASRWVRTDPRVGLQPADVELALEILEGVR